MDNKTIDEMNWRMRVFDSLSFPTLIMTPDRKIVMANQIFLKKYDMDAKDVVNKLCSEVFYRTSICPNKDCPFDKILQTKKGQSAVRWKTSLTGKRFWEDRVFSPILGDDGNVAYVMESVRDITRLKNMELSLREAEAFLEKIIQSSPVAIVAADINNSILLMNPAAEDLFGYSNREAITRISLDKLCPPGGAKEIIAQLRSKKTGGKGRLISVKTTIINAQDEEIPVELNAAIIYEDGKEIATVGMYKDLRQINTIKEKLKKINLQIVQSEKMASLGKLAAGVAHEINNPLTGILMYANIVRDALSQNDSHRTELGYIIEDAERCATIVNNLLTYSRQAHSMKEIFPINLLVEESLSLIRDQRILMNIKIVRSLSDEEMQIKADKNQMTQVIINLVMNAVDAMDRKGALTLHTYRDRSAKKICLEISDTGCGILKENIPKIFDPFFTTKSQGKGTGLGLSTVYGIVTENSGTISVKKTGPEGTTFLLKFPEEKDVAEDMFF
jgi:two-component system NtrC family sensor kinase